MIMTIELNSFQTEMQEACNFSIIVALHKVSKGPCH